MLGNSMTQYEEKEKTQNVLFFPDEMKVIEQDWREKVGEEDVG